jgi:hypothetical protein
MRPQSAVYKCIIPVKKPVPPSGAIYHSLFSEPREGAQTYPFPAWPEIDDPHQPCCLPTLMRAVYFEHHGTGGDFKADVCRSVDYWNKVIDSEIRQQIHALASAQELTFESHLGVGGLPIPIPTDHTPNFNMKFGNSVERVVEAIVQGVIYGNLNNFVGAKQGDFSDVFAYTHELSHRFAGSFYCGRILDELSKYAHRTLEILATEERLSAGEITKLWEEFWQTNDRIESLVQKFEPVEEIFATYMGLRFLPKVVRNEMKPKIGKELKKRNWNKAYNAFSEVCDTCQDITPHEVACFILDQVCRLIESIDIDGTDILYKFSKIVKKIDSIDESDVVARLEQAGIPAEVYWSVHKAVQDQIESVGAMINDKISNDRKNDAKQELLLKTYVFSRNLWMFGRYSEKHIYVSASNDVHDRVYYESLRQQLSKRVGLVCPGSPPDERHSCGWEEAFQLVYDRLPEEYKKYFNRPG